MSNLKEVRGRIQSIKSTRQITSAMKMVSASKLHKAQQSILNLRHYSQLLKDIVDKLIQGKGIPGLHPFTIDHGAKQVLVVSIASNKGLCGTYNVQVLKRTLAHIRHLHKQQLDVKLLLIGKKNENFFRKKQFEVFSTDHEIIDKLSFASSKILADKVMDAFINGEFDRIDVVYNQFKNAVVQDLVVEQLLPVPEGNPFQNMTEVGVGEINIDNYADTVDNYADTIDDYADNSIITDPFGSILEPDPQQVVNYLLPLFVSTNFFRILLDSLASEHGARMTSMHKATDNADDLLKNLTLTYNKVRQSMITRELMEIVGGAEVFNQR